MAQGRREGQTNRLEKDETLLREERDRESWSLGRGRNSPLAACITSSTYRLDRLPTHALHIQTYLLK